MLTKAEMKHGFFEGQPKVWQQQFEESPNVPKPDDMPLAELREHLKIKEDNAAWWEMQNQEAQKKHKTNGTNGERNNAYLSRQHKNNKGKPTKPGKGTAQQEKKPVGTPVTFADDLANQWSLPSWSMCAFNPKNKDHKDLDKFCPKKGKGKPKPEVKTKANIVETVEMQVAQSALCHMVLGGWKLDEDSGDKMIRR